MKKYWLYIIPVGIILDQLTKIWVMNTMTPNQAITVIPDFFWIRYKLNYGVGFSLFEGHAFWFGILGIIVSGGLIYYGRKLTNNIELLGIALIISGTLGNVIDRMMFGYVRDMLSFNLFGYMFPIFNMADTLLSIGVAFLFLEYLVLEKRRHER